jgi:hypothetical protein
MMLRMLSERMETKGSGQEGVEKCLGSGQGPNWAVDPLVVVTVVFGEEYKLWSFSICSCLHCPMFLFLRSKLSP